MYNAKVFVRELTTFQFQLSLKGMDVGKCGGVYSIAGRLFHSEPSHLSMHQVKAGNWSLFIYFLLQSGLALPVDSCDVSSTRSLCMMVEQPYRGFNVHEIVPYF